MDLGESQRQAWKLNQQLPNKPEEVKETTAAARRMQERCKEAERMSPCSKSRDCQIQKSFPILIGSPFEEVKGSMTRFVMCTHVSYGRYRLLTEP